MSGVCDVSEARKMKGAKRLLALACSSSTNTRMGSPLHRNSSSRATGSKLSLIIITLVIISASTSSVVVVRCQDATNSSEATDKTIDSEPAAPNGTLLSASEFVDFTESPTLLFDGTSNENPQTTTTTTTELSSQKAQNTTTTSIPPPTTTAGNATSSEEETTTKATSEEETTTTTVGEEEGDDAEPAAKQPFEPPKNVTQYMDYIESLFHDLRHQISDLFEPHLPQLIRSSQMVQLSGGCSYDMLRMALALRQFEPWALRMIDSSGKVPEGIFEGSFTALGSYDECLNTVFGQEQTSAKQTSEPAAAAPANQTQGKYCLVNVSPYLPPKPPADRVERMFQEEANRRNYTKDNQFSRLSPMFYYMKFRIGVCIPSTCSESDMDSLSEALSSSLRLNITIPNCRVRMWQPITNHQLAGGLVFASVLALVFGATLMDYSRRKLERQKRQLLLSLSPPLKEIHQSAGDSCATTTTTTTTTSQGRFIERLDKNWSWLSFSLFTSYRLHFSAAPVGGASAEVSRREKKLVEDESNVIRCLNGIRVISLCWVIVANSYITLDPRATKRLTKTREAPKDFLFQMVAQASLAIETFFFLSGVLMSLSFARKFSQSPTNFACLREVDLETRDPSGKKDQVQVHARNQEGEEKLRQENRRLTRLRWLQFYVHRYVRMTPATMLVIAFTMYAYGYGDGPLWFEATHKAHQSCSQNWWRHLLHVANFIDTRQMCFIHYWYIAADMQLFLFAPLLLYLVHRYRKVGYALITLIGASSVGFIFYTTYVRNLPPTLLFYNSDPESRREFGNSIMTKPLTHALPYLVGMLVGKWLTSESSGLVNSAPNKQEAISGRSLSSLCGALATVVALAEVFLPYKWNNSHLPTRLLASLYAALFRFAWSLVLAYIIMSCRHRRGRHCSTKPVNDQCAASGRRRRRRRRTNTDDMMSSESGGRCASCQSLNSSSSLSTTKSSNSTVTLIVHHKQHNDAIIMSSAVALAPPSATEARRQMAATNGIIRSSTSDDEWWCLCGTGGNLVNRLLSLHVFTYLSKLSFVAYLIHLPLMSVFIAQTRGLFAFSHTLVIHLALSYLVMTFLLSFVLVHIIELPFLTFERYLFDTLLHGRRSDRQSGNRKQQTGAYIAEPRATFIGGSYNISGATEKL